MKPAILIVAALIPLVLGIVGGNMFVGAQKASCEVLESAVGQLSPTEQAKAPQTKEACVRAVENVRIFTHLIFIMGAYVFSIVLGGFIFLALLLWSMISKKQAG